MSQQPLTCNTYIIISFSQTQEMQNLIQHFDSNNPNPSRPFIISIIGVQSSGKSTFLNKSFGTDFKMLQRLSGKTTCGMWASSDRERKLLILDVEGSNSGSHETQNFERKLALASLIISDIMIINVEEGRVKKNLLLLT